MTYMDEKDERLWSQLPGTSMQLATRSRMSRSAVQRRLRRWLSEGKVERKTRWLGALAHTNVYYRIEDGTMRSWTREGGRPRKE